LEDFRRSVPARGVLVKVRGLEKALGVLEKKGYVPKPFKNYILVENAEPSDVNGLLVRNGITVEEIKRNEPSLEEIYAMLHRGLNKLLTPDRKPFRTEQTNNHHVR
jgi:ABC-2 type transport system ATP-binding protein